MKKTRILFVCKHNMFRSRIAEIYLKKINKDIIASSAGLIRGYLPLNKRCVSVAKEFGIDLKGKPRGLSIDLIRKQNLIITVADDVPKSTFNRKEYINFKKTKIIIWKIPDNPGATSRIKLRKIVRAIIKRITGLNKQLNKELIEKDKEVVK